VIRTALAAVLLATPIALAGCTLPSNNDYHGTVLGSATTTTTPYVHVNAYPVTIKGVGEQVETANLVVCPGFS
jgi:hypothetical protein